MRTGATRRNPPPEWRSRSVQLLPHPIAECAICGEKRAVHTTWPLGSICGVCYRRELRHPDGCGSCGQVALIGRDDRGSTLRTSPRSTRDYVCATCGAPGEQHFENTCIRCSVVRAAGDLLASATGVIPGRLAGLPVAARLSRSRGLDHEMAAQAHPESSAPSDRVESITHARVDACPPGQARHHLRALLVDVGVLPVRDEQTERLETWVDEYLIQLPSRMPPRSLPMHNGRCCGLCGGGQDAAVPRSVSQIPRA